MGISVTYLEADALKASAEGGAGRIVPGKSRPSRAREKAYLCVGGVQGRNVGATATGGQIQIE